MSKKALGTYEIAKICQVAPPTVGRWIQEGKLASFTTGGGHHRVWVKDLLVFMKAHNMLVPPELEAYAGSEKILIVDDDEGVRHAIIRALQNAYPDLEFYEAADGFEAGHKVSALLPSLVFLDLRLPGVDGFRVCQLIRGDTRLARIKILAMSGYSTKEYHQRALAAGANDFLAKPFEMQDLIQRVNMMLPKK